MLAHESSNQFSAGLLALLVHGLFFGILFFGISWHLKPPAEMTVEMWDHLPEPAPTHVIELPVTSPIIAPPQVKATAELDADIALKEKKKKREQEKEQLLKREAAVKTQQELLAQQQKEAAQRQALLKQQMAKEKTAKEIERIQALKQQMRAADEKAAREEARLKARQAQMRADMDEVTQHEVNRYKDLIRAKIRRNIMMPEGVPEQAEAKFAVIVLPGGTVAEAKLSKTSGNSAYDHAVEHAIYAAQPLPLPQDEALARMFRELNLSVKPKE